MAMADPTIVTKNGNFEINGDTDVCLNAGSSTLCVASQLKQVKKK